MSSCEHGAKGPKINEKENSSLLQHIFVRLFAEQPIANRCSGSNATACKRCTGATQRRSNG